MGLERNTPPGVSDTGLVVRPLGAGPGGSTVVQEFSTTAVVTSVNDSNVNQTLLAANVNRRGASVYNDSDQILYLKMGTVASTTSFTVKMAAQSYYEVPFGYSGQIDGIWAADSTGAARITEFT